jgi:hypothetical protein
MLPKKITISTDGNVLEYETTISKDSKGVTLKEKLHTYKYVKSKTKLNKTISLTDKQVEDIISNAKLFI